MAKALAEKLHYTYIDTGAMYRAVALYFMRHGLMDVLNQMPKEELQNRLNTITIEFVGEANNKDTFLNGENVEEQIRSMEVASKVSYVSAISEVRTYLVRLQQILGKDKGVVMDGRDIGTVVFPHAELKLFMTADPKVRAERRRSEMANKGQAISLEEVMVNLTERDRIDSTRADSPLRKAEDAVVLDNTFLSPSEQFDLAYNLALKQIMGE